MLARKLEIDPVEIRLRNLIDRNQFPYETPSGAIYDSGDYKACLKKAVDLFEYEKGFRPDEEEEYDPHMDTKWKTK